mmetsp:Transcript_27601/g.59899  ORF Transcript_27601/g.59899 Transcript_27601/m.59899 type:complete len:239 (+) Transcript_27601:294-1010(+)
MEQLVPSHLCVLVPRERRGGRKNCSMWTSRTRPPWPTGGRGDETTAMMMQRTWRRAGGFRGHNTPPATPALVPSRNRFTAPVGLRIMGTCVQCLSAHPWPLPTGHPHSPPSLGWIGSVFLCGRVEAMVWRMGMGTMWWTMRKGRTKWCTTTGQMTLADNLPSTTTCLRVRDLRNGQHTITITVVWITILSMRCLRIGVGVVGLPARRERCRWLRGTGAIATPMSYRPMMTLWRTVHNS